MNQGPPSPSPHSPPDGLTPPPVAAVTQLLVRATEGDSGAARELLPLVYEELRRLASSRLAAEPGRGKAYTLQATALVHEAYLRLVGNQDVRWDGRGHFFGAAALAMRRILVERARRRSRLKHGGAGQRVELNADQAPAPIEGEPEAERVLALDEAMDALQGLDKRKHEVVMLRYFAGLSIEDTAAALGVSPATVKNDWAFSRAWLRRAVAGKIGDAAGPAPVGDDEL